MSREESDSPFLNSYQLSVVPPIRVGPQGPLSHAGAYKLFVLLFYYIDLTFLIILKRKGKLETSPIIRYICA